jgi:hypothetical protein
MIHYMGHIISIAGMEVDLKKIESVRGWKTLKNVIEVRSFIGLVIY